MQTLAPRHWGSAWLGVAEGGASLTPPWIPVLREVGEGCSFIPWPRANAPCASLVLDRGDAAGNKAPSPAERRERQDSRSSAGRAVEKDEEGAGWRGGECGLDRGVRKPTWGSIP